MSGFSIDRNKGKISDIKQNIENNKGELAKLEENKQNLLDAGTDIQASDIDEDTQKKIMDLINQALEENAEKGEECADAMTDDVKDLEDMRQETQESMQSNEQEKEKLEKKKALLDRVGLGGSLEEGIAELDDNRMQLDELMDNLSNTEQELNAVSQKLRAL